MREPTAVQDVGDARVPWHYGDVAGEYAALRGSVGVIDLTAAGLWSVSGRGARNYLQPRCTRDVAYLTAERSVMGLALDDDGTPLDIWTVYRTDDGYLVETAVGRSGSARMAEDAPDDVEVVDVRDRYALLGFEGPRAWEAAAALLDEPIDGLPFQGVRHVHVDGADAMVSRTGVTGEFGFKIMVGHDAASQVWERLCEQGGPAGHEALETTMVEVRQPLLHRELGTDGTVLRCGLNWMIDLDKEDFRGRDAVVAQKTRGSDVLPVSLRADGVVPAAGTPLVLDDEPVGHVVHAVWSFGLDRSVAVGRVDTDLAVAGLDFALRSGDGDGRATSVASPMQIPTSWRLLGG